MNVTGSSLEAEKVPETSNFRSEWTRLVAREDYNVITRRDDFSSYMSTRG
jgi:hypothetical protein